MGHSPTARVNASSQNWEPREVCNEVIAGL